MKAPEPPQGLDHAGTSASGMRDTSPTPERAGFWCASCGREVVTAIEGLFYNPPVGSERRFCDHACRQAAYRRRRAGVEEGTPLQRKGGRRRRLNPGQGQQDLAPPIPNPSTQSQEGAV
jgi:hypothetical protein